MKVKVTLRNPLDRLDLLAYTIQVADTPLAQDWAGALKQLLASGLPLEKNYCFMGFPASARGLEYLCAEMNSAIVTINRSALDYTINEEVTPDSVVAADWAEGGVNHDLFNRIHRHFERLQGTVENLSGYYLYADPNVRYAIRQLNLVCHELETLILSQRQARRVPEWVRPSQITTWPAAPRLNLTAEHRLGFLANGYDRELGGVYMHWTQIGKTLMEVFRDEGAPELTATVCEAITHLQYYSGEFDVEWGRSITACDVKCAWHTRELEQFETWLRANGLDPADPDLSLGYLRLGQVDLVDSFGTDDYSVIWSQLSSHLDIYSVEVDGVVQVYDYCWTDANYKQEQIRQLQGNTQ